MYRAIIRYPLEDVEMRELYDNKEDARLDAMISVAFRYMEAEKLYKSDPEMFKCAEEYVLHAKLVLRKVDGEEKRGRICPFLKKQYGIKAKQDGDASVLLSYACAAILFLSFYLLFRGAPQLSQTI